MKTQGWSKRWREFGMLCLFGSIYTPVLWVASTLADLPDWQRGSILNMRWTDIALILAVCISTIAATLTFIDLLHRADMATRPP